MITYREWFNERTELNEMAVDRKKAEQVITALSDEIFEHIIKVLYWVDEYNYTKHCNDIDTWLKKIDKIEIKPNSKRLKQKDYFEWLYNEFNSSEKQLKKTLNFLNKKYSSLPRTSSTENEIFVILQNLYKQLSLDLEKDELKSIRDYIRN